MKKSEITPIAKQLKKLNDKRYAAQAMVTTCEKEMQETFAKLAKKSCPYKRGQVFKQKGAVVFAKMTSVSWPSANTMFLALRGDKYFIAPYEISALRCNSKGEVVKGNKHIFIEGHEVGNKWSPLEDSK